MRVQSRLCLANPVKSPVSCETSFLCSIIKGYVYLSKVVLPPAHVVLPIALFTFQESLPAPAGV